jgi:riboflavin kinase/FMN adenylyltransferase
MTTYRNIEDFSGNNPVVTVGIFDGVHLGHRFIIERLKQAAERLGGESTLVTLWPHPRMVLNKADNDFRLLNTLEEKTGILEEEGIDHLVVIPFTTPFSRLSSCDFIREYLVEKIGIRHLVVGYNHRFGRDREGNFEKLSECAGKFRFGIEKVPPLELDAGEVSSSRIRECIENGNIKGANHLLGSEYFLSGKVVGGSRLGTSIGFPTANITPGDEAKLLPCNGVYAVRAKLENTTYPGMLNIGTRPTVNDDPGKRTIEVHLLDFAGNIYSEQIVVRFIGRLRDEYRFTSTDALREQLVRDRQKTRELLGGGDEQNSA